MEKCNFLKILQCPDFENLWGDSWHLFQPKKLDESDGGFCFWRIIFSSHVTIEAENELSGKKSERTGFGASCNKSLHHICPPSIQNSHEEVKSKSN